MYEYVILNSSDFPKEICSFKFKAMGTRPIFHFATSDNVLTVEASPTVNAIVSENIRSLFD